MSQQPMSALEAVRRRPELYFQLDRNLLNQYVVGAMCLALAEVHHGSATQIRVAVDGSSFSAGSWIWRAEIRHTNTSKSPEILH